MKAGELTRGRGGVEDRDFRVQIGEGKASVKRDLQAKENIARIVRASAGQGATEGRGVGEVVKVEGSGVHDDSTQVVGVFIKSVAAVARNCRCDDSQNSLAMISVRSGNELAFGGLALIELNKSLREVEELAGFTQALAIRRAAGCQRKLLRSGQDR